MTPDYGMNPNDDPKDDIFAKLFAASKKPDMTPEEYIEHKKAHPVCVDCGRKEDSRDHEAKILIDRISKEHVCKECAGNRPFSTMRFGRL